MAITKSTDPIISVEEESPVRLAKLSDRYADESYKLLSEIKVDPPTPEEALRICRKAISWILPFICVGYHLMYVDKQTVGSLPFCFPNSILLLLMHSCSLAARLF